MLTSQPWFTIGKGIFFFATGNYKEAYNSYYAGKNVATLN